MRRPTTSILSSGGSDEVTNVLDFLGLHHVVRLLPFGAPSSPTPFRGPAKHTHSIPWLQMGRVRVTKKWKPLEKPRNRFGRIFGENLPAVTPTRKLCTPLSLYIWCFRENYLWMLFISTYTSAAVIGNENAFTVWAHTKPILFLESRNTGHHVSKRNPYFE